MESNSNEPLGGNRQTPEEKFKALSHIARGLETKSPVFFIFNLPE
jgi:hypothetical protein